MLLIQHLFDYTYIKKTLTTIAHFFPLPVSNCTLKVPWGVFDLC